MATAIEKKITGYKVKTDSVLEPVAEFSPEQMHEGVNRPYDLQGRTYKIKTPDSHHAIYVTVNDIVLNAGTDHEERRPYEVFINSKNMEHFQWVTALTRVISAVFRKGGDITFLAEELRAVFDPRGGYFERSTFVPSLVAKIGMVLEQHLASIGVIKRGTDDKFMEEFLAKKREEVRVEAQEFPNEAILCQKCSTKAVVRMDGCLTCLNCGDSKCS